MIYRAKPHAVDARQWDGTAAGLRALADWVNPKSGDKEGGDPLLTWLTLTSESPFDVLLATIDEYKRVEKSDWIVEYVADDFIVVSDHYFKALYGQYELVEEWRVVTDHTRMKFEQSCRDEELAHEWAASEREEYPHATVTIEHRHVGEWRTYEP